MKFTGIKWVCRVLIASLLMLQFSMSQAAMIGAEEMLAPSIAAAADRAAVSSFMSRSEAASQLQSLGVDPQLAQDRVASMTDSEVQALAGHINEMPAGAMAHGWWLAIAAVIIGLAIYYNWKPMR